MRIFIVEDDSVLADGLKNSLIQSGYAIDVANNGADADSILAYQAFDLYGAGFRLAQIRRI